MGMVWEAYHKGVPILGVPRITLELGRYWSHRKSTIGWWFGFGSKGKEQFGSVEFLDLKLLGSTTKVESL